MNRYNRANGIVTADLACAALARRALLLQALHLKSSEYRDPSWLSLSATHGLSPTADDAAARQARPVGCRQSTTDHQQAALTHSADND